LDSLSQVDKQELIEFVLPDGTPFLTIKDKRRRIVPYRLNPIQKDIVHSMTGRDIYVKPRQVGASEIFVVCVLLDTLLIPGTNSIIIAYEEETTKKLLAKSDFYYDYLNSHNFDFIPQRKHDSEFKKTFKYLDKNGRNYAPTSSFYIASARSFVVARSDTYHNVIADEYAYWPSPEKLVEVLGGVPDDGNVYILSTPNGEENSHTEMYRAAKEKLLLESNVYTPHFYAWFQHPEYRLKVDNRMTLKRDRVSPLVELDSDELMLMAKHNLCEEQIRWRRYKMAEIEQLRRMGETRMLFSQEFPEDDETCFLTFGDMAYEPTVLKDKIADCFLAPIQEHHADIWYPPEEGKQYLVAIDPGLGKESMTAITVWNFYMDEQGKEVGQHCATAHGLWEPEMTSRIGMELANFYNRALLATERNIDTVPYLIKRYSNLYYQKDLVSGRLSMVIGWLTGPNKMFMRDELARLLPNMIIHDARIVKELRNMRFVTTRNHIIITSMGMDDLHDSTAIAVMCRTSRPVRRGYVGSYGRTR